MNQRLFSHFHGDCETASHNRASSRGRDKS
jgi:hypothetical protein